MAAYAHESITVADSAIGFTAAQLTKATSHYGRSVKRVFCTAETAEMRVCWDGTTPSTTVGHLLAVGDTLWVDGADASLFRAIRTGAASGGIKASFEI